MANQICRQSHLRDPKAIPANKRTGVLEIFISKIVVNILLHTLFQKFIIVQKFTKIF